MQILDKLKSSNKSERRVRKKFEEAKGLSITSLMDVLTIILVFLVKNISTDVIKNFCRTQYYLSSYHHQ